MCQILPEYLAAQIPTRMDLSGTKLSAPSWSDFPEIIDMPLEYAREKLQQIKLILSEGPPLTRPAQEEILIPNDDAYLDQQIMVKFLILVF